MLEKTVCCVVRHKNEHEYQGEVYRTVGGRTGTACIVLRHGHWIRYRKINWRSQK